MRTRAVVLRRRGAPNPNRILLMIFGGILGLLAIAFVEQILSQAPAPQPTTVVEQAEPMPEYLWDPERMGQFIQRELDKVEAVR